MGTGGNVQELLAVIALIASLAEQIRQRITTDGGITREDIAHMRWALTDLEKLAW